MSEQSSLLDQSALTALAERLVEAARRAGADAADAVAVRSMALSIEVRDGAVEESERSESDDFGLRVLVGRRQAVVSSNDLARRHGHRAGRARGGDGAGGAGGPVRRARRPGPAGAYACRISICSIRRCRRSTRLEELARAAEAAALAVDGVTKSGGASASAGIGGMVLVTSHGFRGAYLGSSHSLSMVAIAGEGTGDGARLRIHRRRCTPPISTIPRASAARPASAPSSGSIRARSTRIRCRWCSTRASPARWSGTWRRRSTATAVARGPAS